ncbi:MAG: shikimate dehydrogenase family protein [Xanthobacteraceae bacterium]
MRLGLIGDNIAASRSPALHRTAGTLCGLDVSYDLLVPRALNLDFDATFDRAHRDGYRGLNITYPYKERVLARLKIDEPIVRSVAACNTVVFQREEAIGTNTDYSGFLSAYRGNFGASAPGRVAMAGCGGVGKAIGFALAKLDARALHVFDTDRSKADRLAHALASAYPALTVQIAGCVEETCEGADGLVNCTPFGMTGHDGSAFPERALGNRSWAFDAVYTPIDTPFLRAARAAGFSTMSGYELLLHQGVDCFRAFTGREVDVIELRRALREFDGGLSTS